MSTRLLLVALAALLATGCPEEPADETPTPTDRSGDAQVGIWRLVIEETDEAVRIVEVEALSVQQRALVPIMGPDYLVASYDAEGAVLQATPVGFGRVVYSEGRDGDDLAVRELEAVEGGRETVFLRRSPDAVRIDVVAEDGTVVATTSDLPATDGRSEGAFHSGAFAGHPRYAHIRLLGPGELADLPAGLRRHCEQLVPLAATDRTDWPAVLLEQLDRVSDGSIGAVRTLAFARYVDRGALPGGGNIFATTVGSAIIFNDLLIEVNAVTNLRSTLVHEAGHSFTYLTDTSRNPAPLAGWPEDIVEAAYDDLAAHALSRGLPGAWNELQLTGRDAEVSVGYGVAGSAGEAIQLGFPSLYGSSALYEDIAEVAVTVQFPDGDAGDGFCPGIRNAAAISPSNALPYAKLRLALAIGLIDQGKFDACVGSVSIEGPEGVHFGDTFSFDQGGYSAGFRDFDGTPFFAVQADGPDTYQALIRVRAPDDQVLGLHRLDSNDLLAVLTETPLNGVYFAHEVDINVRASYSGLVLITDITSDTAEGALFMLTMQNAFGQITEPALPFGTFRIGP